MVVMGVSAEPPPAASGAEGSPEPFGAEGSGEGLAPSGASAGPTALRPGDCHTALLQLRRDAPAAAAPLSDLVVAWRRAGYVLGPRRYVWGGRGLG